ncbi:MULTISPECIES: hypothetical protein [unclassified Streptomyces]|uniref:hypothetical protein n=1 Tax=unclassified Streptomyces TaxID=2593676 RepID=UPI00148959A4|nr:MULTISPECIES: hypothetical protein [unclassified Streptomyces]
MFRRPFARWLLLGLVLVVIGLWPAAAAPIGLAAAGAATVIGVVPGPVLLLAGVVAWLKHRPTPKPATA